MERVGWGIDAIRIETIRVPESLGGGWDTEVFCGFRRVFRPDRYVCLEKWATPVVYR